ncbi:MAG: electron transport complex subunit E [Lachnospiraceae bacterium]|nr:electron transport complex subunit E [Lachnospiraceae bacterium]
MNKSTERLYNGIIKENPTFVLTLGMCPTLAVTTSAINGLGMGLSTMVVLALSNLMIAALRNFIPNRVRIPAFIVIVASFVTMTQLLLQGFVPSLYKSLGIYIPLIVVNCIILGRAESYASKNPMIPSLFDGIGMGLGFTMALTMIGLVREILGSGKAFGFQILPDSYVPISIFIMAPGAFFVLAALTAIQNKIKIEGEKKGKDMSRIQSGCNSDCAACGETGCGHRFYDENAKPGPVGKVNAEETKAAKAEVKAEAAKAEVKAEAKEEVKAEAKEEVKEAVKAEEGKEENK